MSYEPAPAGVSGSGAQYNRGSEISAVAALVPAGYSVTPPPVARVPLLSVSQPSAGQVLSTGLRVTSEAMPLWPTRPKSVGMPACVTSLHCKPPIPSTTTRPLGGLPAVRSDACAATLLPAPSQA